MFFFVEGKGRRRGSSGQRRALLTNASKALALITLVPKIFDVDNTLATAMIDRLMHHGEAYVIRGESYRMKDKQPEEE